MFENILKFFKKGNKKEKPNSNSKDAAKERLHLVLMQDRANVSADFLDLMRQEIIEVIKKYIDIDESTMDVKLTNQTKEDGTQGAPVLYANIPIVNIKEETKKLNKKEETKKEEAKKIQEPEKKELENKKDLEKVEEVGKENKTEDKNDEKEQKENTKQDDENRHIEEEKIEEAKKIVEEETKTDSKKSEDDENK